MSRVFRVHLPPEPSDILWENMHINFKRQFQRRCFTTACLFLLIFSSLVCVVILKNFQISQPADRWGDTIYSFALGICITIINALMTNIVRITASYEYWESHTRFHSVVAWRVAFI